MTMTAPPQPPPVNRPRISVAPAIGHRLRDGEAHSRQDGQPDHDQEAIDHILTEKSARPHGHVDLRLAEPD